MAIIISYKGSPYGMACAACKQLMIAPNWSEYVGENQVRHFCCCEDCGNRLERLVDLRMELIPKPSSYVEALVSLEARKVRQCSKWSIRDRVLDLRHVHF
jgi:hypothetical protein